MVRKTSLMIKAERKAGKDLEGYLKYEYSKNKRPTPEIAEDLGVSKNSIIYWLNKFNIPLRSGSEAQSLAKAPGTFKSRELQRAERKVREPIDTFLRREYEDNKKPATELARYFRVHNATLYTWLRNYGIQVREKSEAQSLAKLPQGVTRPSKEELERLYIEERKSTDEIGKSFGVYGETVANWMKVYSIRIRKPGERQHRGRVIRPPKNELRRLYVTQRKSANEIAEGVGVTSTTVLAWLAKYRITTRNNSQAQLIKLGENVKKPSKKQLERLYYEERKGTGEIAGDLGVTQRTVMNWMLDYKIPTRSPQEAKLPEGVRELSKDELERMYVNKGISAVKIGKQIGVGSTTIGRWLKKHEIKRNRPSKEELERLYNYEGMNAREIAEMFGVTHGGVYGWMKKYDISRRDFSASKLPKGFKPPSKEELKSLYENKSLQELSEQLGVSVTIVRRIMQDYDITIRGLGKRAASGSGLVIKTSRELEKFLDDTPEAQQISHLASVTYNFGDIANVFAQLWPERFPSASQLARSLPGAVKRIGYSLHPFTLEKARGFYKKDFSIPKQVRYNLEELLLSILIDQYQQPFDSDPKGTLKTIRRFVGQKNGVANLAKRVLDYYESVAEFEIPGYGRIKDAV